MKHICVVALMAVALLISGCRVLTSGLRVVPSMRVVPAVICPGESVTVTWDAGEQPDRCGEEVCDDEGRCMTVACVEASVTPPELISMSSTELRGSRTVSPTESTGFCLTASSAGESEIVCDTVNVVDTGGGRMLFTARGDCAAGPVWDTIPLGGLSACLVIDQLCNTGRDPVTVVSAEPSAIERTVEIAPGECISNFRARDLNVSIPLSALPLNTCGTTFSTGPPPPITLAAHVACDSSLPGCQEGRTASEPVVMGTPDTPDGPIAICDLDTTCGNGVCEAGCENGTNCAADCAVTTMPDVTPQLGLCGAPCDTSVQCGVYQGVQLSCFANACWDACQCGGDCGTGGDTGGQPDPCKDSCGNQVCEPACGETPNTCTSDCP